MKPEKQKVLLFGLGFFEKELLKNLAAQWYTTAVDIDESRLAQCQEEIPAVEYVNGAADSVITWKKLNLKDIKYIISGVKDVDVNLEVCRIVREVFKLSIPIILLIYREVEEKIFEKFNATLVKPLGLGIRVILKKLEKNVAHAVNIGLGKGELIEVSIMTKSHLVDRKLRYLRPSRWHISALYRDGKLILPDGNSSMKVGDRVILVGDPLVLEDVTARLVKGLPQFPLQYGTDIVFPYHTDFSRNMDETIYWMNIFQAHRILFLPFERKLSHTPEGKIKTDIDSLQARKTNELFKEIYELSQKTEVDSFDIGQSIELFKEIFTLSLNIGVLVVPADRGWLKNSRIRKTFKKSAKPFLLSRFTFPYKGIIISLDGPDPVQALQTGIEMARLAHIPYRVLYVTFPKAMLGREDEERISRRENIVSDFEGIYKKSINYEVLEGNPVKETLKYLAPLENHVLVLTTDPGASISFFKPNVPYLVAKNTHLSTLVIPEANTNE